MEKDDILNAALGKRIKEIRQKRNLSQDSFAEMIDVCNGTHVSNIERGLYGLSLPRLVQVCKALHVNADYLLFGTSSNDIETALHAAIEQLNGTQKDYLIEIIRTYCKACGVETAENILLDE